MGMGMGSVVDKMLTLGDFVRVEAEAKEKEKEKEKGVGLERKVRVIIKDQM